MADTTATTSTANATTVKKNLKSTPVLVLAGIGGVAGFAYSYFSKKKVKHGIGIVLLGVAIGAGIGYIYVSNKKS